MTRIDLTQIAYDARRACFYGQAALFDGPAPRLVPCQWHGPRDASAKRIRSGLTQSAACAVT